MEKQYPTRVIPKIFRVSLRRLFYSVAMLGAGAAVNWIAAGVFVLVFWAWIYAAERPRKLAIDAAAVLIVLGLLVLCLMPTLDRSSRLRQYNCFSNLRQIHLALEQYHDTYNAYPPPIVADAEGRPLSSWRVLLLPFIGEVGLSRQFRLDEPWNSDHNLPLANTKLKLFECPLHSGGCCYHAVIGDETMWPRQGGRTRGDVKARSETIVLVERYTNRSWAAPDDPTLEEFLADVESGRPATRHYHEIGPFLETGSYQHFVTANGIVHRCPAGGDLEDWRRLLTLHRDVSLAIPGYVRQRPGGISCLEALLETDGRREKLRVRWDLLVPWICFLALAVTPAFFLPPDQTRPSTPSLVSKISRRLFTH